MTVIPIGSVRERSRSADGRRLRRAETESGRHSLGSFYLWLTGVVILNLFGLVMVLSASSVSSIDQYGSPWHFFERQALWLAVGVGGFAVALRVDRRRWRRISGPLLVVAVVMLVAVLVPHVGVAANGASRWIGTSSFQLQPSELAKPVFILFAADVLDRRAQAAAQGRWRHQIGPVLLAFLVLAALIVKQPDLGTTMVLALIMMVMLFAASVPKAPLLGMVGLAALGVAVLSRVAPYRWQRLVSFMHPLAAANGTGYQAAQSLGALYSGHLTGNGIGNSVAAYGYLPNAQTDYIFAIIGQETGLAGTVLVTGVFAGLGLVGMRIACRAKDRFSGLLAAGITAWLVGQAFVNIGAVVGLLPVEGVPLPFVSYGGSSTVIELFAAGLLANIARNP